MKNQSENKDRSKTFKEMTLIILIIGMALIGIFFIGIFAILPILGR